MKRIVLALCVALTSSIAWGVGSQQIDLSHAVVVLGKLTAPLPACGGAPVDPVARAGDMLTHEVAARSGITFRRAGTLAGAGPEVIAVTTANAVLSGMPPCPPSLEVPKKAEGYAIWVDTTTRNAATVCVVGRDARGAVFGVGRLLRSLRMKPGTVAIDEGFRRASAPEYALRGQHLGYDNGNNTFDAWTLDQFKQYCRDLFAFGVNAIELCPRLDPSLRDSPHMKRTMWDMNIAISRFVGSYGMNVWAFIPIVEKIEDPDIAAQELAKRAALFKAMPQLDAVMVPGGDPGDTALPVLLPFLEKLAVRLHQYHPHAGIWLSDQGFPPDKNAAFFQYLNDEHPNWLAGVVFGPWTKVSLQELRRRVPKKYPIRFYPDITHSVRCQYPVPHWDQAYAHTEGRECANPRPTEMARIHNLLSPFTIGSIPYSEGSNDDFNKILWSALDWDSTASPESIAEEYGRYFIGNDVGKAVGEGLLAEERDWQGPLKDNAVVDATFKHWQAIEAKADAKVKGNWRFQRGLFRAYYDEYDKRRLAIESRCEARAYAALARADQIGPEAAIRSARKALAQADPKREAPKLRRRIKELGLALFHSVGAQLSVKPPFLASGAERGAVLDFLDQPLNDGPWLEAQFRKILAETGKRRQLAQIAALVNWEKPGPGSFYDDLGNATKEPHLVSGVKWANDPGYVRSPQDEFARDRNLPEDRLLRGPRRAKSAAPMRLSWLDMAETLYGVPLRMRYEGLDPKARYRLRVTYAGRFHSTMRLVANGSIEIHGPLKQPAPIAPVEFAIPKAATSGGSLELAWQLVDGRGCQVAEVWLLKQ